MIRTSYFTIMGIFAIMMVSSMGIADAELLMQNC